MTHSLLACLLTALCLSSTSDSGVLEFTLSTLDTREHASTIEVSVRRIGAVNTTAWVTVRSSNGTAIVSKDSLNTSQVLDWLRQQDMETQQSA